MVACDSVGLTRRTKETAVLRHFLSASVGCLLLAGLFAGASAQEGKGKPGKAKPEGGSPEALKDRFSTTRHSITLNGTKLEYEATAGSLVLKAEDGKARRGHLLHGLHQD